ncbi:MAG: hypothetical protein OWU84_09595 [Firmicutes bacterium]|nr:hypothetical protein [Bacillota bacterium]
MKTPTIDQVLAATGYLSEEQLWRYYHLRPQDLAMTPEMLWHNRGLWHVERFRGGHRLRHRALVTEVYLTTAPLGIHWGQVMPPLPGGACPDAILTLDNAARPVLLEVDTGKETERQWRQKLARYQGTQDQYYLWVVADGGPRRLKRLRLWLAARAPLPWQLSSSAHPTLDPATWERPAATVRTGECADRPWRHRYVVDGQEVPDPARLGCELEEYAEERRHRTVIHYLRRGSRAKVFPRYGRNSPKTARILGESVGSGVEDHDGHQR